MNAIIVRPPPNVNVPTLRRNALTSVRLAARGGPRGAATTGTGVDRAETYRRPRTADKAQSAKQTTPPTPSGVTQKHAELCSARSRQHIDEREAFDEPFFGDPLPLFLELGLHDAHDGGTTVSCRSQLEQVGGDILPVSCEIRMLHGRHLFLPADASCTTAAALRLHWAPLACPTSIRTRAAMTSRARP